MDFKEMTKLYQKYINNETTVQETHTLITEMYTRLNLFNQAADSFGNKHNLNVIISNMIKDILNGKCDK